MGKINIKLSINNKENPYKYEGIALINKDIVSYNHNGYDYVYDLRINRLIKSNKENNTIIDFDKEEIIIDNKYNLKIKIKTKIISDKERNIIYNIDKNEIEFKFIMGSDLNE